MAGSKDTLTDRLALDPSDRLVVIAPRASPPIASWFTPIPAFTPTCSTRDSPTSPLPALVTKPLSSPTT